jgi:Xaa-Pro aminopeptidase
MLGLDTHDVSLANYELQEGNVFTVEPGLYIEEENIGIRIEDNVLVTSDGCINLSADIIKEIAEIEAFMQK